MKKIIYFVLLLNIYLMINADSTIRIKNNINNKISNKISIFSTFLNQYESSSIDYREIDVGFNLKHYTEIITNIELFNRQNLSKINNQLWTNRYDWITGITFTCNFISNRLRIKYIDSDYLQIENRIKFKYKKLYASSECVYYRSLNSIKYVIGYSSVFMTNIIYGISYNWDNRKVDSGWETGSPYVEIALGLSI